MSCAEEQHTSGVSSPAGRPVLLGIRPINNAPCSAKPQIDPSSSSAAISSSGTSDDASFDEARRRFSPGILMPALPGRLAQHEKDIGRGER